MSRSKSKGREKQVATPTSISFTFTVRIQLENRIGKLAEVLSVIGRAGGDMGAVDIVRVEPRVMVRDLTIHARDEAHEDKIVQTIRMVPGVTVVSVSDRVFLLHLGGKIQIQNKLSINTRDVLSMAYTPGVARVCKAIVEDKAKVYQLTVKKNSVAVITDGSAVLGLGNIGPEAALPVMEGKAMLFKEFADIDAYPICLGTQDVDEIVATVKNIATGFGAVNLEDIGAPRCFEIERRLREQLDIPVMHDDQHGTAVVVLAAIKNSLKIVKKQLKSAKIVIVGAGAAGTAIAHILYSAGARNLVVCDKQGILEARHFPFLDPMQIWLLQKTNPHLLRGRLDVAIKKADVFIGVSGPGVLTRSMIQKMDKDPVIFALANPEPEIPPQEALGFCRILATGRSDIPNQINNVLAFPGIFRGALDVRAFDINEAMKLAAARAIAAGISSSELNEEYIVPSVFNKRVTRQVARAVSAAAYRTGVARRRSN
jgi:malate dehydrogenase (oxaloacetate-decarboxylating)